MERLYNVLWLALTAIVAGMIALLAAGGYFRVVVSPSMTPTLRAGDLLVIGPSPFGLQPGMIVTYQHTHKVITHRIVAVGPQGLLTKGDANPQPDDWVTPAGAVIGIAYLRIPYAGYLSDFIRRPGGWLVMIMLPAAAIVIRSLLQIIQALRQPLHAVSAHHAPDPHARRS